MGVNTYLSLPELYKLRLPDNPHPLVLTLSATPSRLKTVVPHMLHLLANQFMYVRINLPAMFRNREPYDPLVIKTLQNTYSNLDIQWGGYDHGPITKILQTLHDYKSVKAIVSIDDDIYYSPHIAATIMTLASDCVHSGNIQPHNGMHIPYGADVIVYPTSLITSKFIRHLEYLIQTPCKMHDDMMVAITLKSLGISVRKCPRMRVSQTQEQYSTESLVASTDRAVLYRTCDAVYAKSVEFNLL